MPRAFNGEAGMEAFKARSDERRAVGRQQGGEESTRGESWQQNALCCRFAERWWRPCIAWISSSATRQRTRRCSSLRTSA